MKFISLAQERQEKSMGHNEPEGQAAPTVSGDKLHEEEMISAKPFEGAGDSHKADPTRLGT